MPEFIAYREGSGWAIRRQSDLKPIAIATESACSWFDSYGNRYDRTLEVDFEDAVEFVLAKAATGQETPQ